MLLFLKQHGPLKYSENIIFVSVPPQKIVITNESGVALESVVGPFSEGASFKLRCDVFGGKYLIILAS